MPIPDKARIISRMSPATLTIFLIRSIMIVFVGDYVNDLNNFRYAEVVKGYSFRIRLRVGPHRRIEGEF